LPAFVADQDSLNASSGGADVVAWVTTGFTHVPKPEDYPVMSAEHISLRIAPHGPSIGTPPCVSASEPFFMARE
jgi:primary-amine oxidase